jgi:hypothetical protein
MTKMSFWLAFVGVAACEGATTSSPANEDVSDAGFDGTGVEPDTSDESDREDAILAPPCASSGDCYAVPRDCCGACDSDPMAVNGVQVRDYAKECRTRGCTPCRVSMRWLPICEANRCVLTDLFVSSISACQVDDDCRLRWGVLCCETCFPMVDGDLVAVSRTANLCSPNQGCDPCGSPPYPSGATALCRNGHCAVGP